MKRRFTEEQIIAVLREREAGARVKELAYERRRFGYRRIHGVLRREGRSMDFQHDVLANGQRFRTLNIVDDFSRECPVIEVDTSLAGRRVVRVLDRLKETRGLPKAIVLDNGPEMRQGLRQDGVYCVRTLPLDPAHGPAPSCL